MTRLRGAPGGRGERSAPSGRPASRERSACDHAGRLDRMPGQKAPEEERREQILQAAYVVALRAGIDGVTVRAVAAEAGLSHGLVLFHFKRKDQLVAALLDRVLATTTLVHASADGTRPGRAPDRLRALLRQELEHLVGTPRDIRLFFEYWALG